MTRNFLQYLGYLLLSLLFLIGCKKESKEVNIENITNWLNNKDECRLLSASSEFGEQTFTYNRRRLLDQTNISSYDGYFKMEYNELGRLIKSRYYSEGVLVNTIVFAYQYNRVVKETWYVVDTQVKDDEIFYTYNRSGNVIKSESTIGDYSTVYKYTPDGNNVAEFDLYFGGIINYTQQFTFISPHHKDPFLATPGLNTGFPFINGGTFESKWYSTSEKDISYDENGMNPAVTLDQDAAKSIIKFNQHNYVTATDFFDNLTQEYSHFKFVYENCGNVDGDNISSLQQQPTISTKKTIRLELLRLGSAKSIKEQLKELRNQILK